MQCGKLRTLGRTQKQIKRMIIKEGSILSLIGSATGITIGAIIAYSLRPKGFDINLFLIYTLAIFNGLDKIVKKYFKNTPYPLI